LFPRPPVQLSVHGHLFYCSSSSSSDDDISNLVTIQPFFLAEQFMGKTRREKNPTKLFTCAEKNYVTVVRNAAEIKPEQLTINDPSDGGTLKVLLSMGQFRVGSQLLKLNTAEMFPKHWS